jgi:hypothetical protein
MNLGTLGTNRFGGQVSEEKAGIGTVRQSDASRCAHAKAMTTIDPLESVALRPAMGECGEDQDARHEAERAGRKSVHGLERREALRLAQGSHQRQHLTTQR